MIYSGDMLHLNPDGEIDEPTGGFTPTTRVVIAQTDTEFIEDEFNEMVYSYASDDDDFRLDGLDNDFFNEEIELASDEQLSIVDAYEIGIGYGLDEEELAQLTGKPN